MWFIRTHAWALCFAVFVGLCAIAPAFVAPLVLGEAYRGIQYMYQDDDDLYRARMHEILDGHGSVVSPFVYEYKDAPANVAPVGEWLYALPAFVVGLPAVFLGYKFLLPAILFFLVYLFTRTLLAGEDRVALWTSLAAACAVTLGYDFVDYGYVLALLRGADPGLLVWTRSVNPVLGAIALFGFLLLVWRSVDTKNRRTILAAGVLLGLMVGYYFAWGMALSLLAALFFVYIARREYGAAWTLSVIGFISLVVVVPYLYQALSTFGGDEGLRASMRTGMVFTHELVFNKFLWLATVFVAGLFGYAYWRGVWREHVKGWIFIAAMLAAGWLAFNEQVITGRQIWYYHFVQYTIPFSYVALLAAAYFSVRTLVPRLWMSGVGALIILGGAYGLYTTTSFIPKLDDFARAQNYGPVMEWLNEEAPEDCVVLAVESEERAARWIPAYTQCNTYNTTVVFYAIPDERILHNYLLQLRLLGIKSERIEEYLFEHELDVRGVVFTNWDELFDRGRDQWFEEQVTRLSATYRAFIHEDLEQQILRYRADYVLSEGPLLDEIRVQLPHLIEKEVIGEFHLYAFD